METYGFKFLDLFLKVSILGVILLAFSTSSDVLGQLLLGLDVGTGSWV